MGIAGSLVVFAIAWWLAFFAVLPVGVRSQVEDGNVVPGSEPGAPTAPHLLRKALYATAIAVVVWATLFAVVEFGLVDLDDIPLPSGIRWR
jgi:predicted secreted protein